MKTRLLCFLMVLALLPCLALAEDTPQKLVVAEPVKAAPGKYTTSSAICPCMSQFTRGTSPMKGWT
jgi:hypothetical protein